MSRAVGSAAEDTAAEYLIRRGCVILQRNVYCRFGEIDIVARLGETLHFVEVKSGRGFEPLDNLTPAKLQKLQRSIVWYVQKHDIRCPYELDALIVRDGVCEWIKNLTL